MALDRQKSPVTEELHSILADIRNKLQPVSTLVDISNLMEDRGRSLENIEQITVQAALAMQNVRVLLHKMERKI